MECITCGALLEPRDPSAQRWAVALPDGRLVRISEARPEEAAQGRLLCTLCVEEHQRATRPAPRALRTRVVNVVEELSFADLASDEATEVQQMVARLELIAAGTRHRAMRRRALRQKYGALRVVRSTEGGAA